MKKLVTLVTLAMIAPITLAGSIIPPPPSNVPEPSTWALFGAAAIAVLLLSKFKK